MFKIYVWKSVSATEKRKKSNCNFLSHDSDFFSAILTFLRIVVASYKAKFWGKKSDRIGRYKRAIARKKSELWDKKSQLPCFIFYSVVETGFHILCFTFTF